MRLYGVTGWKNAGKTRLMERLLREVAARGFSVSSIKHAHHGFDVDAPGRDSYRHQQAGATEVLVSSGRRWALMHELRGEGEPGLEALVAKLAPVDLVLVEGFKAAPHPKIEAWRAEMAHPLICHGNPTVRAVASDTPLAGLSVPRFDLDATGEIAEFLLRDVGLVTV